MINEDIVLNVFLETARKIDIDLSLEALKKIYQIEKEYQFTEGDRMDALNKIERVIKDEIDKK